MPLLITIITGIESSPLPAAATAASSPPAQAPRSAAGLASDPGRGADLVRAALEELGLRNY